VVLDVKDNGKEREVVGEEEEEEEEEEEKARFEYG
jgi:hypothetical protein